MSTPASSAPPIDHPWYGIGFGDAIKRVFQKYATFNGRASRGEFWYWYLGYFIITIVLSAIAGGIFGASVNPDTGRVGGAGVIGFVILGLWGLAVVVPTLAVMVRRLHDAGYTGWLVLLSFIGLGIVPLIMCALETSPKAAQYGPPAPQGYDPNYGQPNPGYAPPPGA